MTLWQDKLFIEKMATYMALLKEVMLIAWDKDRRMTVNAVDVLVRIF